MFVSVRLADAVDSKVLLVPERAIGTDQSKKFLFVVDKSNKAAFREVTLGQSVKPSWCLEVRTTYFAPAC